MIAKFPDFTALDIHHKGEVESYIKNHEPYSDFNFTSMFCWNTDGSTQISDLHGNLVLKLPDYLTGINIYSLIGDKKVDLSLHTLLEITDKLKLVPESVILNINDRSHFSISEDRDSFDYIVSCEDIARLDKNKLPKKLSLVQEFEQNNPDLITKPIKFHSAKTKKQIVELVERWRVNNNKSKKEVEAELRAILRLLENATFLSNVYGIGIYKGRTLVAFNLYETTMHKHGISSFQKGDKNIKGIYAYLTREMAKHLLELGCEYINFEQDLGVDGLRHSKLSYHPVKFLKKYDVLKNS